MAVVEEEEEEDDDVEEAFLNRPLDSVTWTMYFWSGDACCSDSARSSGLAAKSSAVAKVPNLSATRPASEGTKVLWIVSRWATAAGEKSK